MQHISSVWGHQILSEPMDTAHCLRCPWTPLPVGLHTLGCTHSLSVHSPHMFLLIIIILLLFPAHTHKHSSHGQSLLYSFVCLFIYSLSCHFIYYCTTLLLYFRYLHTCYLNLHPSRDPHSFLFISPARWVLHSHCLF